MNVLAWYTDTSGKSQVGQQQLIKLAEIRWLHVQKGYTILACLGKIKMANNEMACLYL